MKPSFRFATSLFAAGVFVFMLIQSPGAGPNSTVFAPFFFIQMADPQFGMWGPAPFTRETPLFDQAIDHANRLKPPFIVLCGDFVQSTTDTAQRNAFKRGLARLDPGITAYLTPGNHDIGLPPSQASIGSWNSEYGPDRFSFVYNNCLFIFLNSPIIKDSTGFPAGLGQQYAWLDSLLRAADQGRYSRIFVLQHYPFFLKTPAEANAYFSIDMPRRTTYLNLLRQHGVSAVFAGHLHDTSTGKDGTLSMVTTGGVGQPLGTAPSGIRIVKVYADSVIWPYYGMNAVPQSVTMPPVSVLRPVLPLLEVKRPGTGFFAVDAAGRKIRAVLPGDMRDACRGAAGLYFVEGGLLPVLKFCRVK